MGRQDRQIRQAEADQTAKQAKSPFSDVELEYFRNLVIEKREEAVKEIEGLRKQLATENRDQLDSDSAYSLHMADAATDAMERERIYIMIDREKKLIGYLDRALQRIENKTYGICRATGKPIAKERLEAIPHTEISIEAKLREQGKFR